MSAHDAIERRIQAIRMPEIDVSDRVMARLETQERTCRRRKLRRSWALACAALMTVLGTGYVSVSWIGLFQQDGRPSLIVRNFDGENPEPLPRELAETYLGRIAPGEAIAVYDPSVSNSVVVFEKPVVYVQFEQLRSAVNGAFPLPERLPAGIELLEGRVYHEPEHPDISMLEELSRLNDGQAAFAPVSMTETPIGLTLIVSAEGREYTVVMGEGSRWSTVYTELARNKEARIVPIRGTEGLVAVKDEEAVLLWRSPRELGDVYYQIGTTSRAEQPDAALVSVLERMLPRVD